MPEHDREYLLPEPAKEVQRLQDQDESIRYAMNGNIILAPVDLNRSGLKILDSATADGLFLREISPLLKKPYELNGTDVMTSFFSPNPPPMTTFSVQDITKPWPASHRGYYDFVHQRFALAGCGSSPPEAAIKGLCQIVAPGGWIQIGELDAARPDGGPAMEDEWAVMRAVFDAAGVGADFAGKMKTWLKEEGFVDVTETVVRVPLGKACADADIGTRAARVNVQTALALSGAAKAMGAKVENSRLENLGERLGKELTEIGGAYYLIFVYGRKPGP